MDNYSAQTGTGETDSQQERAEQSAFLDAIMETGPMQFCHKYLVAKGKVPADVKGFKNALYQMWFSFYRREQQNDSCGFEHVFLGERKDGEVSGFHNWMMFWIEECKGHVDYKGYMHPRNRSEVVDNNDRIISCQLSWHGDIKTVTTMFIGTSPEFEFALYTLYFVAGQERTMVMIDGYEVELRCYRIRSQQGDKIGSCFPDLKAEHSQSHS
ncbi:hypothetical protein FOA52_009101 [Chlamydomonas sp. UWO 241]|nr:hypothetical protein FOA52_009101 [Chlamydomonas sp. UWO 241]